MDITDSMIAVDGVKEGLIMLNKTPVINSLSHSVKDFSFVSIEVGVPFATSENALTIYNCPAAERYEFPTVLYSG